MTVSGI